jgi:hypothetical protein
MPRPLYSLERKEADAPQNRSGRFGKGKNILPLTGFELRAIQPVPSRYTELRRLFIKKEHTMTFILQEH